MKKLVEMPLDDLVSFGVSLLNASDDQDWVKKAAQPQGNITEVKQKAPIAYYLVSRLGVDAIVRALQNRNDSLGRQIVTRIARNTQASLRVFEKQSQSVTEIASQRTLAMTEWLSSYNRSPHLIYQGAKTQQHLAGTKSLCAFLFSNRSKNTQQFYVSTTPDRSVYNSAGVKFGKTCQVWRGDSGTYFYMSPMKLSDLINSFTALNHDDAQRSQRILFLILLLSLGGSIVFMVVGLALSRDDITRTSILFTALTLFCLWLFYKGYQTLPRFLIPFALLLTLNYHLVVGYGLK